MKKTDDLPDHYSHDGEFGRETSTVFPALPDPEVSKVEKVAKVGGRIAWRFWLILSSVVAGIFSFVVWMVMNHSQWRSVYDTYQDSLGLPILPPLIDNNPSQEKKP